MVARLENPAASARRAHSSSCGPVVPRTLLGTPMPMSMPLPLSSGRTRPTAPPFDGDDEQRPGRRPLPVLRVPLDQCAQPGVGRRGLVHDLPAPVGADPPQPRPVVLVVVDEEG